MKRVCPVCGNEYTDPPAVSRWDGKTLICPTCGQEEAIEDWNGGKFAEDKEEIVRNLQRLLQSIRKYDDLESLEYRRVFLEHEGRAYRREKVIVRYFCAMTSIDVSGDSGRALVDDVLRRLL